jgi:hypothetical protein
MSDVINKLLRLLNDTQPVPPYTEVEVKEYVELQAIGEGITEQGWGITAAARWNAFLVASEELDKAPPPLEISIVGSALETASDRLLNNFGYSAVSNQWELQGDIALGDGYRVLEDMMSLNAAAGLIKDESSWLIGNIATILEEKFGDEYDPSMMAKATGMTITTVYMNSEVFKAFRGRRVLGASYSMHKEVLFTRGLPVTEGLLVLREARDRAFTVKQTRYLCKTVAGILRNPGNNEVLEITEDIVELSATGSGLHGVHRYFVIKSDGTPVEKTGTLAKNLIRTAQYICMTRPVMRIIKDERHK